MADTRRQFLQTALAAFSAQSGDLTARSLAEASALVRSKRVSPVELTRSCLQRIEQLNPKLNAFITVTAEQALEQARRLESEAMRSRWRGPLHGVPIALKDLIDTAGIKTTAGSAQYTGRVPTEDAEVVRRLNQAGAVLLGKLNMDEFAYNFTSETSHYGPVPNPWNPKLIPGGSSGGSAVAVATGLCFGALGSDTGGSIRLPAALCGIAGLKPTYGRISTRGVVPLAWSLDHLGPMCRTVEDAALMLGAMAGYDPEDSSSVDAPVPNFTAALKSRVSGLRLGVPRAIFYDNVDAGIGAAVGKATDLLAKMTAGVREVVLPPLDPAPGGVPLPALSLLIRAEAYTFHAKMLAASPERYHPATRQSIAMGAEVPLPAYVEARRELARLRRAVAKVFADVDLLITPSVSQPAFALGTGRPPDLVMLRNAMPFNIYGLPAISIPCGFTPDSLPIGLQIAGPFLGEEKVLALAHAYEQATEWHRQRPAGVV